MLEKLLLDKVLKQAKIHHGRLALTYSNGSQRVYGDREPTVHATITNPAVVRRMLLNSSIGFGDGYMYGDITIPDDELLPFMTLLAKNLRKGWRHPWLRWPNITLLQHKYIADHYDEGNDFYDLWLDDTRAYTCAYFKDPSVSLKEAQQEKIDRVLRKLRLQPGQSLLDMGCGWGQLAVTAAKQYNVNVLAVTISEEQVKAARELAEREGVSGLVTFEFRKYQDVSPRDGLFDAISSIGMIEHVGRHGLPSFFAKQKELLEPGGISLAHCITQTGNRPLDAWTAARMFKGGYLHSVSAITREIERHGFWLEDVECMEHHYVLTLQHWLARYKAHRDEIIAMYDEMHYRRYLLWLTGCIVAFGEDHDLGLNQWLFTNGKRADRPLTRDYMSAKSAA